MGVSRPKLPIPRSYLTASENSPSHGNNGDLRTKGGPWSARVPTVKHLPAQLVCLPASQDMLGFNGYEWLPSPSSRVVVVQRSGTTARAGSSLLQGEFQKTAIFYSLHRAEYLPGWFPRICIFTLGGSIRHCRHARMDVGMAYSHRTGCSYNRAS